MHDPEKQQGCPQMTLVRRCFVFCMIRFLKAVGGTLGVIASLGKETGGTLDRWCGVTRVRKESSGQSGN